MARDSRISLPLVVLLVLVSGCTGGETQTTQPETTTTTPAPGTTGQLTNAETMETTTTVQATTTTEQNPWRTEIADTWKGELASEGQPLELILFDFGALQHRLDLTGAPTFAGNWDATETEFILRHNTQGWSCAEDVATYGWDIEGDELTLSSIDDDCPPRRAHFDQTFTRG